MQIKKIKMCIQTIDQSISISGNILDVAKLNIVTSKKKIEVFDKALNICSKIIKKHKIPHSKKMSIVLFSDSGFCGSFNKCSEEFSCKKTCIGKKSPYKTINLYEALQNYDLLDKLLGETYNIEVYIKNFKTQAFEIFKFPTYNSEDSNEIISYDNTFLKTYRQYFMEYCIYVAIFNENSYRVCFMNNVSDNCKNEKKKLNLVENKLRQELINNEISICSSKKEEL